MKPVVAFDVEIYKDYLLIMFRNVETGNTKYFELYDGHPLDSVSVRKIMNGSTLVSFNGIKFDLPIIYYTLADATNAELKECCDYIIVEGRQPWQCEEYFEFKISKKLDHIDLFEVANGKGSLKAYGGRLHSRTIQDLPIDPSDSISPEQRTEMIAYCGNDLQTTIDLYKKLLPQLELRAEMGKIYGIDLRSKSDAQIAEHVIKSEVEKILDFKIEKPKTSPKPFYYRKPDFIMFETEQLQKLLEIATSVQFVVTDGGKTTIPKELAEARIEMGKSTYTLGIGGLHSNESCVSYESDGHSMMLSDHDVASYYPSIILILKLFPEHIGNIFLEVYRNIFNERIEAKKTKNIVKSEVLKICLNGAFGKFGSKYSCLFSPNLLMQVTITGQLSLLMLIEQLELAGISVISANTDGIVLYHYIDVIETVNNIIAGWELTTGFQTEETLYKSLHSRDVNNYIAIKKSGGIKLKGAYAPPEPIGSSWPNPHGQICVDAAIKYLTKGINITTTIANCKDIKQFVYTRQVKGGAVKDGVFLGKVCRWYYSYLAFGAIHYKINGYTVPRSEGAMPLMTLPDEFPEDVDIEWYVAESYKILEEIGCARIAS